MRHAVVRKVRFRRGKLTLEDLICLIVVHFHVGSRVVDQISSGQNLARHVLVNRAHETQVPRVVYGDRVHNVSTNDDGFDRVFRIHLYAEQFHDHDGDALRHVVSRAVYRNSSWSTGM